MSLKKINILKSGKKLWMLPYFNEFAKEPSEVTVSYIDAVKIELDEYPGCIFGRTDGIYFGPKGWAYAELFISKEEMSNYVSVREVGTKVRRFFSGMSSFEVFTYHQWMSFYDLIEQYKRNKQ